MSVVVLPPYMAYTAWLVEACCVCGLSQGLPSVPEEVVVGARGSCVRAWLFVHVRCVHCVYGVHFASPVGAAAVPSCGRTTYGKWRACCWECWNSQAVGVWGVVDYGKGVGSLTCHTSFTFVYVTQQRFGSRSMAYV